MKKILLLYASYGTGHRSICNYINDYFKSSGKFVVKEIDLIKYSMPIIGNMSKKMFESLILNHPYLWDLIYNTFDNKVNSTVSNKISLKLFENKRIKQEIIDYNPDVVISTHFMGSSLISKYNKKEYIDTKLITIVTDYKAHNFWFTNAKSEDAIIVTSIDEKINLILKGVQASKIKTYGMPIRKDYINNNYKPNVVRKKLNIKNENRTCLFYGGGGCGQSSSYLFLKELIELDENLNIIFVAGKNEKLRRNVDALKENSGSKNLIVKGFISNAPELLSICDFVITKPGGVTVTECLYNHKPMVLLKTVGGQEKGNCNYLVRKGYAKSVKNPNQIKECVKNLIDNFSELDKMNKRIEKIEDKKPMEKLFDLVCNMIGDANE